MSAPGQESWPQKLGRTLGKSILAQSISSYLKLWRERPWLASIIVAIAFAGMITIFSFSDHTYKRPSVEVSQSAIPAEEYPHYESHFWSQELGTAIAVMFGTLAFLIPLFFIIARVPARSALWSAGAYISIWVYFVWLTESDGNAGFPALVVCLLFVAIAYLSIILDAQKKIRRALRLSLTTKIK